VAVITMPTNLPVAECSFGQVRYDLTETSDATGSQSARILAPPRWKLSMASGPLLSTDHFGLWSSMLMQLRGKVNTLAAFDTVRTEPAGTMRGTMTLNGAHAAGATTLSVVASGQASKTLLRGDMLQIGTGLGTSQTVMVMADATSNGSGVISLTVEPPLRAAYSGGTAVAWQRPLIYCKLVNESTSWTYTRAPTHRQGGMAADLLEVFA
jgi:hypothetical protein